jgi:hypothetical protein
VRLLSIRKTYRLGILNISALTQMVIWTISLPIWIKIYSTGYSNGWLMIIASIFMIVFSLFYLFQGKATISNEGIIITGTDTELKISWNEVVRIEEKQRSLILHDKVQFYNRGLFKPILGWYKVSAIPIYLFEKDLLTEISKYIIER